MDSTETNSDFTHPGFYIGMCCCTAPFLIFLILAIYTYKKKSNAIHEMQEIVVNTSSITSINSIQTLVN